ncbi:hypothetical protein [Streptomyces sp. NBC_01408]|uniref:hypothetical protein n=1 Tax=Streptomyces sp. NBC_01408 TaxID=2903855 RepID=UPI00225B0A1E|nr:hypothetical protein [Streptomyces sp. NBC_01408]MCX4693299.1 hypothetical protein [Streptomyces sp. NBC_01408]
MDNTLLALAGTTIAVAGTLLAPVLSQRLLARAESDSFERQERVADAQWVREQQVAELGKRRECYVTANSGYRRYRIELMKYLWLVHKGGVTAEERTVLDDARHAMHASFAEVQMVASDAVLAELDSMAQTLAHLYDRVMRLEEGNAAPDGSFEEIQTGLLRANAQWVIMRGAMRADLGVDSRPAGRSSAAPDAHAVADDGPQTAQER